jgi:uncharacterized protein
MDKVDPTSFAEIGRKGGQVTRDRHGLDHYRDLGIKGGAATRDKYGPEHYRALGRKGGAQARALMMRGKALEG